MCKCVINMCKILHKILYAQDKIHSYAEPPSMWDKVPSFMPIDHAMYTKSKKRQRSTPTGKTPVQVSKKPSKPVCIFSHVTIEWLL